MRRQWAIDRYLAILWRRKLVLVAALACGVAAAVGVSTWFSAQRPNLYESQSTGRLALAGRALGGLPAIDQSEGDRLRDTSIYILEGSSTLSKIIKDLNLSISEDTLKNRISITPIPATELIVFKGRAESASEAQAISNALLNAWTMAGSNLNSPELAASFIAVESATVPERPSVLSPTALGALGAVAGLIVGIGLVLVFSYSDDTVNSVRDLASNSAVLSSIPRMRRRRGRGSLGTRTAYDLLESPQSRLLTIKLLNVIRDQKLRSIVVLSTWRKEGVSSVATSVALGLSQQGLSVLLVDANLTEPSLARTFSVGDEDDGLTTVLSAMSQAKEPTRTSLSTLLNTSAKGVDVPGFKLLPGGPRSSDALSPLASPEMRQLVQMDGPFLVIDSPPVSQSADVLALASFADAVILVCAEGRTTTEAVDQTLWQLQSVGAEVLGIVYNRARNSSPLEASFGDKVN